MTKVKEGAKAPSFALKDKDGHVHKLNEFDAKYLILYFYPKDSTPGCTLEAQGFNKVLPKLKRLDVQVVGISGGNEKSKAKFCAENELTLLLLSDPDQTVARKYGAFGEKKFMGRTSEGILRKTFLLDREKKIVKIYEEVKPAEHIKEVLADLKDLAPR